MRQIWRALGAAALLLALAGCNVLPAATPAPLPTTAAPTQAPAASTAVLPAATDSPAPTVESTAQPAPPGYLVLIVLDAARPDYLEAAEMPALRSLIQNGAYYPSAWVGAMENSTPAGHAQIGTGVFPNRSGVTGRLLRNNALGVSTEITSDDYILSGQFAALVEQSGAPTLAGLVKQKYPDGVIIALSGGKHYAAQALGVGPADYILYAAPDENTDRLLHLRALPGKSPGDAVLADSRLSAAADAPGDINAFTLSAARVFFEQFQPRALLVTLPETDDWGHASGADPAVMAPILQKTDAALAELIAAYRQAGIFEQTLWVVVSDHGMSAKYEVINPEDVLAAGGVQLEQGENPRIPVYLNDPARAPEIAAQIAGAGFAAIQGVYYRELAADYQYQPIVNGENLPPGETYRYLLSTYASQYTPDVVVFAADGAVFDDTLNRSGGEHTMTNWHNQHVPLLFSGAGVQPGAVSYAPARLVDVLPTIAQVMGLAQANFDGTALADALVNPPSEAFAAQTALNAWLSPLRDALEASAMR